MPPTRLKLAEPMTKGSGGGVRRVLSVRRWTMLVAIEAGATAVIQPGGSIRDDEVIKAADDAGIAMVFTGVRHFRRWSSSRPQFRCHTREGGYPVRRGFSIQSQPSLGYWIIRLRG